MTNTGNALRKVCIKNNYSQFDGRLCDVISGVNSWFDLWESEGYTVDDLKGKKFKYYEVDDNVLYGREFSYFDLFSDVGDLYDDGFGNIYTEFHLPLMVRRKNVDGSCEYFETDKFNWSQEDWIRSEQKIINYLRDGFPVAKFMSKKEIIENNVDPGRRYGPAIRGLTMFNAIPSGGLSWIHGVIDDPVSSYRGVVFSKSLNFNQYTGYEFHSCTLIGNLSIRAGVTNKICIINSTLKCLHIMDCKIEELIIGSYISENFDSRLSRCEISKANFIGMGSRFIPMISDIIRVDRIIFDEELFLGENFKLNCFSDVRGIFNFVQNISSREHRINASRKMYAVEGGLHNLRKSLGDNPREHLLGVIYKYDLTSKSYNFDIEFEFRVASTLYRFMSDYGYSILRPLFSMAFVTFLFSLFYLFSFTVKAGWVFDWFNFRAFEYFPDAGAMALSRMVPLLQWGLRSGPLPGSLPHSLRGADGIVGFAVQFAAIVQTLLCTGLLFLSGLAAKRRFKIEK